MKEFIKNLFINTLAILWIATVCILAVAIPLKILAWVFG